MRRPRPRLRCLLGIALPHKRIKIRERRRRYQKPIVLVEQVGLEPRPLPQQAHHQFRRLGRPRILERMLPTRQPILRPDKRANKRRYQQRRTLGIHQAESYLVEKSPRLLDRPDGLPIQAPFLAPQLLEFLLSHKKLSAISRRLSVKNKTGLADS